jgi:flagellar hook-basal body complex protein FliE
MTGFDGIQAPRFDAEMPRAPDVREGRGVPEWSERPRAGEATGFSDLLQRGVESVSDLQQDVQGKLQALATGETQDVHDVLLAMGKADVAFQLMLEIRNRLVESWREITRLQV